MNGRNFLSIAGVWLALSLAGSYAVRGQSAAVEQANKYFQAQEWAKAAAAYESATAADPKNAAAWFRLGSARHHLGQYEKAIEAYQQARNAGFPPPLVNYNIICAHSRMGKVDDAFQRLNQMLQNGWAQVHLLETDADLDNLRKDARFEAALLQARKNARPCDYDANYRMFDFWVGDWNVTVRGQQAGTNRIELIENNCIVFENWTGAGGGTGRSFNFYNNQTKKWNQVWVASNGSNIFFEGEFRDGNLHYTEARSAQMARRRCTSSHFSISAPATSASSGSRPPTMAKRGPSHSTEITARCSS